MNSFTNTGMTVPDSKTTVKLVSGHSRYRLGRFSTHLIWRGLLSLIRKITHTHTDGLEFKLGYSVRDLLSDKGRLVKDQVEALAAAVQKAGSYQARDEAVRAVHAVMDALNDRVPPDVLIKLSESLPVREAARLRRAASEHLHKN